MATAIKATIPSGDPLLTSLLLQRALATIRTGTAAVTTTVVAGSVFYYLSKSCMQALQQPSALQLLGCLFNYQGSCC
jgi:hypothetical protein